MNSTGFSVTVDALETLKIVGIAYGVYDHAEGICRDCCRVTHWRMVTTALVVQEDVSLHGSPFGKPCVPLQMTRNGSSNMWHFGKR